MADKDSRSGEDRERTYTAFLIAGESFAVDVGSVKEIVKSKELIPLKEPLKNVEGFVELHSMRIPVLNTARILKLEPVSADTGIMVVNIEGYIVGLMVDIVADMEIFTSVSRPAPLKGKEPFKGFIEGALKAGDKSINVLALSSLMSSDNRARLFGAG